MTLNDYICKTEQRFMAADLCFAHGTDNALDETVFLVYACLGIDFELDFRGSGRALTATELELLDAAVRRRIELREPVAYIVGEAWFCGYPFYADNRALIPRSPIAELIQNRFQPLLSKSPDRILDMCTGGGCIGIACALEFPAAQVDLVDVSAASLALARENIGRHGASDRVRAIESNLFAQLQGGYDLIVANPPYVSKQEVDQLPQEFHHEPRLGLESAEEGLQLPLAILAQAHDYLNSGAVLIMELGYSAERLQQRLASVPFLWLEFEAGGEGVMAITREQLVQFREDLN